LDVSIQAKLLQVPGDGTFSHFSIPIEGDRIRSIAPRIVATAQDRLEKSGQGYFGNGAFSKIHFASITVPPLRDRKEQIPSLLDYYFNLYEEKYGKDVSPFS